MSNTPKPKLDPNTRVTLPTPKPHTPRPVPKTIPWDLIGIAVVFVLIVGFGARYYLKSSGADRIKTIADSTAAAQARIKDSTARADSIAKAAADSAAKAAAKPAAKPAKKSGKKR